MGGDGYRRTRTSRARAALLACAALAPLLLAGQAAANPEGAQVVAGQAAVTSLGATTTVTQTTNRAIVNWQGFSIGAGETTRFVQPGAAAAILNRVTGGDPSRLMGQLTSNGRVYLINPHGVVVGPEGRIATAGFVASTLDVPDAQFLAGGPLTFQGTSGAGIKVLGTVEASDGDVVLIATNIENRGRVAAPNGQAILGAGGSLLYMPDSGGDVVIQAPAPAAAIDISGTIEAAGAQIKAAGGAYALAVNVGGTISATAVRDVGGRVVIDGGEGDVAVAGAITARHGEDGGEVRVLAGGTTDFTGSISARGGETGGDGGFVEVSGKTVDFLGRVDVAAPRGRGGHLLIDPVTASIDNTNIAGYVATLNGGGSVTVAATASLTVDTAVVSSNIFGVLKLDAPDIAVNADIDLAGALQFLNSEFFNSGATGPLTLAPGATITAGQIYAQGHFDAVDLRGVVVVGSLDVDTGFSPTSFTATNPGNQIGALVAVQQTLFSGDVSISSSTAMSVDGEFIVPGDLTLRTTSGNLTFGSGTVLTVTGTSRLAGANAFVNNAGTGLIAGSGRTVIYTSTEAAPFTDGGLGYAHQLGVAFGSDPQAGNVIYVSSAIPLLTITANSFSRLYGQPDPTFTASFSGGSASDLTSPVQFRIVQGAHAGVGTYTIEPFGAAASGFDLQYFNGTLTVTPAPLTIAAIDIARLYGAANPTLSASFSGLVNGDTAAVVSGLALSTTATSASGVGRYAITASGASAANYTITYAPGVLTVNPAPLVIFANGTIRTYGAPNPTFSSTYEGLVNGDNPNVVSGLVIATTATQGSDVGLYPVTASGATAANYTISYRPGQLLIQPAPLTVTANNFQVTTGSPPPPFSASYAGFVNGDGPGILDVSFRTDPGATAERGTYAITPSGRLTSGANYTLTFVGGVLTVVSPPPIVYSAVLTTSNINTTPTPKSTEPELIYTINGPVGPPDLSALQKAIDDAKPAPVVFCSTYCFVFGQGGPARAEFDRLIENVASQIGGLVQPPITAAAMRLALSDPDRAETVMGALLPFIYARVSDILAKTSLMSGDELAFVQAVADYVTAQKQAAADQALADLQAWAWAQHTERQEQIESLRAGDGTATITQMYQAGILSTEPPIPPAELIQQIQVGFTLNNRQLATYEDLNFVVGQAGAKTQTPEQIAVAAAGLIGFGSAAVSGVAMMEKGIDSLKLTNSMPALQKIMPNSQKLGSRSLRAGRALVKEGAAAAEAAKIAGNQKLYSQAIADVARGEKMVAAASKTMGVLEAIPVVGEILAVAGEWVTFAIAANSYREISDFEHDFQTAYDQAKKPTTVADLKGMLASEAGQQQMFAYLTAMAATGGKPPVTAKSTATAHDVVMTALAF